MYEWKGAPELIRAVGVGLLVALALAGLEFDGADYADPGPWLAGAIVGVVQGLATAVLTVLTGGAFRKA